MLVVKDYSSNTQEQKWKTVDQLHEQWQTLEFVFISNELHK